MKSLIWFIRSYFRYLFFIPLPIIILLISQWQMSIRGPYFEGGNSDPEYAYLLNGLKLANGISPSHVDHPGTTLQILTALIIDSRHAIKDILVERTPRSEDVLQHSEEYLLTIRDFLAILAILLFILIAVQIYNKTKLVWVAICFQIFPFLSRNVISALTRVSPEPLLLITILFTTIILFEVTEKKLPIYPIWQPIFLGLILGIGLVTKLTFLPFVLLIFWFPRLRDRILATAVFIGTIFLFTIPIWPHAKQIAGWIKGLVTKQGYYGSGPTGFFPPFKTLISNLNNLTQAEPFYFIVLAILILWCIIIWKSRSLDNKLERLRVFLSMGILIIQLIMVMKFPSPHYLVPGLSWLGFILLMGTLRLKTLVESTSCTTVKYLSKLSTKFKIISTTLVTALFVSAIMNSFAIISSYQSIEEVHLGTKKIDSLIKVNFTNCSIIPYYGASDLRYALMFGNDIAGRVFAESLTKIFPDTYSYTIWGRQFISFSGDTEDAEIQHRLSLGECILLRGGHYMDFANDQYFNAQLVMDKKIVESNERVYLLRAILPKARLFH